MRLIHATLMFSFLLVQTDLYSQKKHNYIQLSDNITTVSQQISGFDRVEISDDFTVYLTFANSEKVEIEANENLHDLINVEKTGRTLKISTQSYSTSNRRYADKGAEEKLVAYISTRALTEIDLKDDVIMEIEGTLEADQININMVDDCTLTADVAVEYLIVDLDGDSTAELSGSALSMKIRANEDSLIKGEGLRAGDVAAKLKGDSEVKMIVDGDIDLNAKGDSLFEYRGSGSFVSRRLSGDSEVATW